MGGFRELFEYLGRERRALRQGTRAFSREIDIGEARVFVDHGFQWDGHQNVWLTRARASYALGAGPVFELKPRPLLARVTGIFGGASSGDPCFDDFFTVRTADPEGTWAALTTRVRSLLAGSFEDARLISDGRDISLWREGEYGFEADAEAAVEVVAELANFRADVLRRLRRLPASRYHGARGSWDERTPPWVSLNLAAPVRIGPLAGSRGPVMTARAECGRAAPRYFVQGDAGGGIHGDAARLPGHTRLAGDVPGALGACAVYCNGREVSLQWESLQQSRETLIEGARLVAALSRSASSLYR